MKPFDKAAAMRGAKVCTRGGRDVRILCFDLEGAYHYYICAAIKQFNGEELINCYTDEGYLNPDYCDDSDLMMAANDYRKKLDRGDYDQPDHIGKSTERIDWGYWCRMYAGIAMQGLCAANGIMKPASMVANVVVEYADTLIEELKKGQ